MDATAWVAVAGIAATLVGSMVGPLIHEQVRRRSVREEQLRMPGWTCTATSSPRQPRSGTTR